MKYPRRRPNWLTRSMLAMAGLLAVAAVVGAVTGSAGRNEEFEPQNEFKLEPWIEIDVAGVDLSFNKAVLYLLLACAATAAAMVWVARRMAARPNRMQTLVEAAYELTYDNIARGNMAPRMAAKWFPFVATLFFFIFFSNTIGFIPLPVNSEETIELFGIDLPAFAIYAATANLSTPLVLALVVWFAYHVEGVRTKGVVGYVRGWIPRGTPRGMRPLVFAIEVISQSVRIVSLSVRLFANMLAGHLLILFMGGGLAVLLGVAALGVLTMPMAVGFFLVEIGLVATLQAFIFATLTSIYLGEATADDGH